MKQPVLLNDFLASLPVAAICIDENRIITAYNPLFSQLYQADIRLTDTTLSDNILFNRANKTDTETEPFPYDWLQSENVKHAELSLLTQHKDLLNVSADITPIKIKGLEKQRLVSLRACDKNQHDNKLSVYRQVFNKLNHGIYIAIFDSEGKGEHGQFIEANEVSCHQLGYQRDELLQLNARAINPTGNVETIKAVGRNIKRDGETRFNAIHVGKDGTQHSVQVHAKLITIDDRSYVLSICNYLKNQNQNQTSDIEQSRFGRLIELSWDEIYVFDIKNLTISQANTGALDNLGYSKQQINQLKITDLLQRISDSMFHRLTESLFSAEKSQIVFQSVFKRKDDSSYPVEIRIQLSHSEVPPVYLANVQNITERKQTEQNLLFLANHDPLTGLFNRNMFIDKLKESIQQCHRSELLMAVMFLDLDGFKFINDTMGHDTGDKLIIETAKQLQKSVRTSDYVARLGGDEFTVILTNLRHIDDAHEIAGKIVSNISKPCHIKGHQIKTSCSLGITIFPFSDSDDAYSLIKQADTAMYQAKAQGKNTYSFYAATLAKKALNLRQLEDDLKSAFKNKAFEVYFQPKVRLDSRKIYGAEALLRWPNEKYPDISPADFIPIMEKSDFIKEVDLWVLEETCKSMKSWLQLLPDLVISINLSARHFSDSHLLENIKNILSATGVSASNLEIEITEGVLISKTEKAEDILIELKNAGFGISLDDFGSGYSSLSYLKQLPINCLKIDRAFIMDLDSNKDSQVIIEAIINMAKSLDLAIIAEGIETEFQAQTLSKLACNQGQGYLFSAPCPDKDFLKLLQSDYK